MAEDLPAFIPVTLLTGFLGSGKTTLLRRLLADPALADTAVIINELGEVGIDHHLVERLDDQMVLLSVSIRRAPRRAECGWICWRASGSGGLFLSGSNLPVPRQEFVEAVLW